MSPDQLDRDNGDPNHQQLQRHIGVCHDRTQGKDQKEDQLRVHACRCARATGCASPMLRRVSSQVLIALYLQAAGFDVDEYDIRLTRLEVCTLLAIATGASAPSRLPRSDLASTHAASFACL